MMSHVTAAKFQREITAMAVPLLVAEWFRLAGVDYTRHAGDLDLRAAAFPTACIVMATAGAAITFVPVALLPLMVARAGRWCAAASSVVAFREYLDRLGAAVDAACADRPSATRKHYRRLLLFVACTTAWWGPLAAEASAAPADTTDATDTTEMVVVFTEQQTARAFVADTLLRMVMERVSEATIVCTATPPPADLEALVAAINTRAPGAPRLHLNVIATAPDCNK